MIYQGIQFNQTDILKSPYFNFTCNQNEINTWELQ